MDCEAQFVLCKETKSYVHVLKSCLKMALRLHMVTIYRKGDYMYVFLWP